jgi:hypothetical protein
MQNLMAQVFELELPQARSVKFTSQYATHFFLLDEKKLTG